MTTQTFESEPLGMLTTKVHGVTDYILGLLLIILPWLMQFSDSGAPAWIAVLVGISIITYSAFTNYELGVVKLIPIPSHLILDFISGMVLIITPWLFGFYTTIIWPHVILGALIILITVRSSRVPENDKGTDRTVPGQRR